MNGNIDYVPLKHQYGARHDWSTDKRVTNFGFTVTEDKHFEGGVERVRLIYNHFNSAEELMAFYQKTRETGELK